MSTDCTIDLDVGGFVRVGFASMDEIKLTAELLAEGWSSAELDRKAKSGEVQRIRRGAYDCVPAKSLDRRDQHRRLNAATVRQTFVDTAVSHMSAAVLHQLPIWDNELGRVHITRNQSGGGKVRRYVHHHVAPLTDIDVCEIEGQRVTTLARTVLDLLRTLPMERSVPIGDTALRSGLTLEELAESSGPMHRLARHAPGSLGVTELGEFLPTPHFLPRCATYTGCCDLGVAHRVGELATR